jgi:hypothetical protein
VSDNNLVRFKNGYVPPDGLKFSMDFNVNGNVDTRDSILAAAAGGGGDDADADADDDDNDEQQWQRSWDLSLFQQAVLVIKRAGATGLTGIELKELFGLNRKECDKVKYWCYTITPAVLTVVYCRKQLLTFRQLLHWLSYDHYANLCLARIEYLQRTKLVSLRLSSQS